MYRFDICLKIYFFKNLKYLNINLNTQLTKTNINLIINIINTFCKLMTDFINVRVYSTINETRFEFYYMRSTNVTAWNNLFVVYPDNI